MQELNYRTRERISTQAGAMDLNSGRLIIGEAVKTFAMSAGLWGAGMLGLLLISLVAEGATYEHRFVTGLRIFVGGFGLGLAAISWGLAGVALWLLVTGWLDYAARLADWHRAELRAYSMAGGQRVDRETTLRALTIQEPGHILWVALALAERARRGDLKEPSAAALTGDVWVGRWKAGELTKAQAEQFGAALHQIGVITGRKKGYAGALATTEPGAIIELVTTRAGRVRQLPEFVDPEEK